MRRVCACRSNAHSLPRPGLSTSDRRAGGHFHEHAPVQSALHPAGIRFDVLVIILHEFEIVADSVFAQGRAGLSAPQYGGDCRCCCARPTPTPAASVWLSIKCPRLGLRGWIECHGNWAFASIRSYVRCHTAVFFSPSRCTLYACSSGQVASHDRLATFTSFSVGYWLRIPHFFL